MEMHVPKKPSLLWGATFALLCFLSISFMSVCSKIASESVSVLTVVFFQNIICFLINLPRALRHGASGLKTHHPFLHATRSIAGVLCFYFLFLSIKYIPLANALLLQNTAPLWIPFVIWIWLKIKVPSHLWWSLVIGFAGVILILKPIAHIINPWAIIGLASGILLAIALVAIKRLTHTEPYERVFFYYFLLGSLFSLPFALQDFTAAFTDHTIFFLLGVAVLFYLAQIFITLAYGRGKPSTLSPLCYSAVLFSAILDWLIWHNIPDTFAMIGMALVIFGGVFSVYLEKKYEKKYI